MTNKQVLEMPFYKKRVTIAEDKNDTIFFQNLDDFLGYHPNERHPSTGKRMTRLTYTGKITSVHILPNGRLLEMRRGNLVTIPNRQTFSSYSEWTDFIMRH